MQPYRERPDWVRRFNQFGPATGDPRYIVPLDPTELLAQARKATGLEEIGDALWHETFERRMRSIDEDSNANLLGRFLCRAEAIRVLQTRLRLYQAWAENPEILEEPIERPIFIVGPPRTGTTILLELLALDPSLRAPISWEAHHPLPHGEATDVASRMAMAEAEQEFWADIQPELMTLHELRADLPCECVHFMSLNFASGYWAMHLPTPSYDEWAATQPDLVAGVYRDHRRFLQTLQYTSEEAGRPRKWLLKSPAHLATIQALVAEYPDAVLVQTHRAQMSSHGSDSSTSAGVDRTTPLRSKIEWVWSWSRPAPLVGFLGDSASLENRVCRDHREAGARMGFVTIVGVLMGSSAGPRMGRRETIGSDRSRVA